MIYLNLMMDVKIVVYLLECLIVDGDSRIEAQLRPKHYDHRK